MVVIVVAVASTGAGAGAVSVVNKFKAELVIQSVGRYITFVFVQNLNFEIK